MPLIALTSPIAPAAVALLEDAGMRVELPPGRGPEGLYAICAEADALIVRLPLPRDLLDRSPKLRLVARAGVGYDFIPVDRATAIGLPVTNVPGGNAVSVAEHVIAQMMVVSRRLESADRTFRTKGWKAAIEAWDQAVELSGRTIGIVGLGAIGKHVAQIAGLGFGMRVLGMRRGSGALPDHVEPADFDRLFAESDFLLLSCPLTEETRGLASAERMARMKPNAWLINVARGGVVDEPALLRLLHEGRIGGAALDVMNEEPPARDNPLFEAPNLLLTPHWAGMTPASVERTNVAAAEEVLRVMRGERPVNVVNPEVWQHARHAAA
ncbi:hydroxyacid dehydrogenase [Roseococcus pinisoli]|uniref:Hydroxyacid dehydrogenase n=1 Tax=Roseococcus pinisoli TaxID=2835040 RepID=A0ABS5QGJ2_9PROT|nr:hydroxyacid dehydrogenase [Roseococcus pinisoli]MBS7812766.1 hydroxyacid dehydrogenase [Roseococcus pinisoli]